MAVVLPLQALCMKNGLHGRDIDAAPGAGLDENGHTPQEINLKWVSGCRRKGHVTDVLKEAATEKETVRKDGGYGIKTSKPEAFQNDGKSAGGYSNCRINRSSRSKYEKAMRLSRLLKSDARNINGRKQVTVLSDPQQREQRDCDVVM